MVHAYDETSRRLSDASSSDPSISSWTATKWLGSDFCLPQVPEGGFVRTQRTPPPLGAWVVIGLTLWWLGTHVWRGNLQHPHDSKDKGALLIWLLTRLQFNVLGHIGYSCGNRGTDHYIGPLLPAEEKVSTAVRWQAWSKNL